MNQKAIHGWGTGVLATLELKVHNKGGAALARSPSLH
jgi:hypothetical protein